MGHDLDTFRDVVRRAAEAGVFLELLDAWVRALYCSERVSQIEETLDRIEGLVGPQPPCDLEILVGDAFGYRDLTDTFLRQAVRQVLRQRRGGES